MVSIIAFNFHPAFYPPKSGGEHRLYHIYKNLSLKNKVTLVTFTYPNEKNEAEVVLHNENFKEIRIPKTMVSKVIHSFINKFTSIKECSAVVASLESRFNKTFQIISEREIKNADLIIFVSPYLFTTKKYILENKNVVYESYNLEHELMKQSLGDSQLGKLLLRYVYSIEKSLSKKSNMIFAVSKENKLKLASTYEIDESKIVVSPNGVNTDEYCEYTRKSIGDIRKCIFIGSFHPPNIEAIDNIIGIAERMPETCFAIAGSAAQYYVNKTGDLVEQVEMDSLNSHTCNKPVVLAGFHNVEYWGSTPTIWSMPDFGIWARDPIRLLKVSLYSAHPQNLMVRRGDEVERHCLSEGFNEVRIPLDDKNGRMLNFSCEKLHADEKRSLGVAVQRISFSVNGDKEDLDITQQLQLPFRIRAARNVLLLGQISDEEKLELYRSADVALNPMLSGSGTNIKMLDYMAAGLPVISTPTGARGLEIESYKHAIICDLPEFPAKITEILEDDRLRSKLIANSRRLVAEKYDWKRIAEDMDQALGAVFK